MLHATLNKILDTFLPSLPQLPILFDSSTGQNIPRIEAAETDLLSPISESIGCERAGIPEGFCPCYPLTKVDLTDPVLQAAGLVAVTQLNKELPSICVPLRVGQITGGAMMDKDQAEEGKRIYVIGFRTEPGGLLLEAEIEYNARDLKFAEKSSILRADRINPEHVKCTDDGQVQLYCFCK
jgi:hypothetical protein